MLRRLVSLKAVMGLVLMGIIAAAMACAPAATPTPTATPTRAAPTPTPTPTRAVVATPTPTPTRPTVAEPSGTVTFVTNLVGPVCGYRSSCPYGGTAIPPGTNDHYFIFDEATGNPMSPFLAESWEVASDGRKVTIRFRKGVKWQTPIELRSQYPNGFGEFDAEDAVWWLNDANGALNPKSTNPDAGDYAAVFGQARVVDKYTMEADLISPIYFGLPLSEFGVLGAHAWHNSKKVYDALGPEKMGNYWVGTGPYVQGQWIGNERGEVEAIKDHWYYPNDRVQKFIQVQVPEVSSRVAMLKAGQADLGVVDFKLVPNLIKEGLIWMPAMKNAYVGASIMFSGNLWEEVSARDGSPLEPWKSPVYEKDYPWIGLPAEWQDRVPYRDTDNPPGMSDMEQARLVRWALSMAIDRDGLVRILTGGMGTPIYSEYTGPEYPNWDPNQTVTKSELDQYVSEHGWTSDPSAKVQESVLKNEPWPWKVPYDPNRARELLRMAGYPNGFDITLNAYVCEIGEVCLEVADAITAAWQAIGLRVTQSREDYGAVISQRMRKREQIWPTLKNGDVHSNVWPKDWPFPPVDTSLSRPGWGPGFEAPFLAEMHKKIRSLRDKAERERLQVQTVDWIMYWHFYSGVLQIPKGTVGNPAKVVSFEGRQDHYSNQPNGLNPAFIRLAK